LGTGFSSEAHNTGVNTSATTTDSSIAAIIVTENPLTPIHVAPLRERKDDIPQLAKHFMELSVKELRCPKPRLTRAAVTRLQHYDWPGNIRELRNVIERSVILARGGPLHFDVPSNDAVPAPSPLRSPPGDHAGPGFLTEAAWHQKERENLIAVLHQAGWKIKGPNGAAELLGIKPTTLLSRLKKMGLQRPPRPGPLTGASGSGL
jgi:DNA-binding NtrC family response regulator